METERKPPQETTPTPDSLVAEAAPAVGALHKKSKPGRYSVSWNPWIAVLYSILTFFVAQLLASMLLMMYAAARGWSTAQSSHWLDTAITAQFWFALITAVMVFGAIWWFVRYRRARLRDIGMRAPNWSDPLRALIGFAAYFAVYIVLVGVAKAVFPSLDLNQKQDIGFQVQSSSLGLVLTFLSLVVLPPVVEETLFRGFIFTSLRSKLHPVFAALITSALFASAHLQFGNGQPLLWVAAIDTFALSLVLCYLRQKTDSLWPGIFLHALKNGIAFFSLFVIATH